MVTYVYNLSTQGRQRRNRSGVQVIHNLGDQPDLHKTLSKEKKGGGREKGREVSWEGRERRDTQTHRDRETGQEERRVLAEFLWRCGQCTGLHLPSMAVWALYVALTLSATFHHRLGSQFPSLEFGQRFLRTPAY